MVSGHTAAGRSGGSASRVLPGPRTGIFVPDRVFSRFFEILSVVTVSAERIFASHRAFLSTYVMYRAKNHAWRHYRPTHKIDFIYEYFLRGQRRLSSTQTRQAPMRGSRSALDRPAAAMRPCACHRFTVSTLFGGSLDRRAVWVVWRPTRPMRGTHRGAELTGSARPARRGIGEHGGTR